MVFSKKTSGSGVEILAADTFHTIPQKLSGSGVIKAGMPIDANGASAADGTGAIGILLYDVNVDANPNAALVVSGIIDWAKAKEHSGATATVEAMKAILPGITFRENIGVNE